MARFFFQDVFEHFIAALGDALLLDVEAGLVNERKSAQRGSAGGGLNVESRAMYRAIAVVSVAAWEDFNEQLVGQETAPGSSLSTRWGRCCG